MPLEKNKETFPVKLPSYENRVDSVPLICYILSSFLLAFLGWIYHILFLAFFLFYSPIWHFVLYAFLTPETFLLFAPVTKLEFLIVWNFKLRHRRKLFPAILFFTFATFPFFFYLGPPTKAFVLLMIHNLLVKFTRLRNRTGIRIILYFCLCSSLGDEKRFLFSQSFSEYVKCPKIIVHDAYSCSFWLLWVRVKKNLSAPGYQLLLKEISYCTSQENIYMNN